MRKLITHFVDKRILITDFVAFVARSILITNILIEYVKQTTAIELGNIGKSFFFQADVDVLNQIFPNKNFIIACLTKCLF